MRWAVGQAQPLDGVVLDAVDQARVRRLIEHRDINAIDPTDALCRAVDVVDHNADMMQFAEFIHGVSTDSRRCGAGRHE